MRVQAGKSYRTSFGETFGPLQESKSDYAIPFFCHKGGHLYTFHAHGGYSNDPTQRHILDLVAAA